MQLVGRPFIDTLSDILTNMQQLLRAEIRLVEAEVRGDLARARPAVVLIAAAAGAALLSALFLLLAIVHALRLVLPAWAAALCVAAGLALAAVVAMTLGAKQFRRLSPPVLSGKVKEGGEWMTARGK
ncbi:MAG: phage holin family protein [Gammaproteobacteria bacterium]|nr:phage holin family protein [Gammaproteobacteria bacterium]